MNRGGAGGGGRGFVLIAANQADRDAFHSLSSVAVHGKVHEAVIPAVFPYYFKIKAEVNAEMEVWT